MPISELDIEYAHVTAPFTGRIGEHQVSIGSLVTGSRCGTSGSTLLATLVSLNPIYLDFHMSEADYLAFSEARARSPARCRTASTSASAMRTATSITARLISSTTRSTRSSGTILARATVDNPDLCLTPGEFARIRLAIAPPAPALLVPDAAVLPDQSQHLVMTVAPDGTVVPKTVETGDLRGGLRVIQSGLDRHGPCHHRWPHAGDAGHEGRRPNARSISTPRPTPKSKPILRPALSGLPGPNPCVSLHFFIDRPIFAIVLSVFLTLVGLGALVILPIAQYPEIVPPTVQIIDHLSRRLRRDGRRHRGDPARAGRSTASRTCSI